MKSRSMAATLLLSVLLVMVSLVSATPAEADTGNLETGARIDYPAAFNNGQGFTNWFKVNGRWAYCLQADIDTPGSGNYPANVLNNVDLQKVLYYGFGGPGDMTGTLLAGKSDAEKYVYTHIAASYAYYGGNDRAFYGCNRDGLVNAGVITYINTLLSQRTPPTTQLSFSTSSPAVTLENGVRKTQTVKLNGDDRNSVTVSLPDNVTLHNETQNTQVTGGTATVKGGDSFHLTTSLDNHGTYDTQSLKGSLDQSWKAVILNTTTGSHVTQNIGSIQPDAAPSAVRLSVDWYQEGKIKLTKADAKSGHGLAGATYGVYSDKACTDKLAEMTTGEDGTATSEAFDITGRSVVYVKEKTAPTGYAADQTVHEVKVADGKTSELKVTDERQTGTLSIQKYGEGLTLVQPSSLDAAGGAETVTEGTGIYTKLNYYDYATVAGVEFGLYAREDIVAPDGSGEILYKAGAQVTTLTTGEDGMARATGLPLGRYYLKELKAGTNYVLGTEETDVTITASDDEQGAAVIDRSEELHNARQKVQVSLEKKDSVSGKPLEGVVFGLYTAEDIPDDESGEVYVKAGTLLEKKATDENGELTFDSELPNGKYYVREEATIPGYLPSDDVWDIDATYKAEDQALSTIEVSHEFENQPTVTKITKSDATTGEELPGARLQVIDKDGSVVEEWTSTEEERVIYALAAGTYTLHEVMPPYAQGYVSAIDQTFEVKEDGSVAEVEMRDEYSKAEFSKKDKDTGKALKGARLQVLDRDGKVLDEWVTDGAAHTLEKLPVNEELTLHEVSAPEGYETASDVKFTLKDTAEVQKVEMLDARAKTVAATMPKTGDDQIVAAIALGALGAAFVSGAVIRSRRSM